ncbi:MAG: hypothetical protein ACLFVP_07085 [Candidatus Bathyarchaeia archaeon]
MKRYLALFAVLAVAAISVFVFTDFMDGVSSNEESAFDEALKNLTKIYEVEEWTIEEYKQYYKGGEEGLNVTEVTLDGFMEKAAEEVEGFNRVIYYNREDLVLWFDDFTSQAGKITIYWWTPK